MKYILTISSPDSQGIIAKVATILSANELNIEKNDEHVDLENHHFFMRTQFRGICDLQNLLKELQSALSPKAKIQIKQEEKKSIIILCTKENHCLGDLLIRHDSGELDANIQAIISNHATLQSLSERFEIPFFHIDSENLSRQEHEKMILAVIEKFSPDLLVLAKYMRILTPSFIAHFPNKIINIHHSFLPAFIGANPYKQAYERGVKIIGATAHFVNDHLDEGPIIVQDTISVDHSYDWRDMQRAGRDVEKVVLARGLNLVLEDRVFVFQNKTIIF
ncbi:formyltetrahydrofolate deformylase [Helicobacter pametensis]|uniref:formyltetrahydrofolate deformylase n=1 Tax=Helicobacter pametensis TaxID=95149 RepID=UPI000486043C|nr:formyltetrahydrofolate deformylase [Helicobacter pametensis]